MTGIKILIIDHNPTVFSNICPLIQREGYLCQSETSWKNAIKLISKDSPDLIILEYDFPDILGPDICLEIRRYTDAPVLFYTNRSAELEKIVAFSSGADDFIPKDVGLGEFIARIKANLRRYRLSTMDNVEIQELITAKGIMIDPSSRQVKVENNTINLTSTEYNILSVLIRNPKMIFSNEQIYKQVWDSDYYSSDPKTVAVHISSLRRKIDTDTNKYILNIRGVGYKFNHELLETKI